MLNVKLLLILCLTSVVGCATTGTLSQNPTNTVWNEMVACADEAKINPLRAKCDERFAQTPITAPVDSIKVITFGAVVYLAIDKATFLGSSKLLSCLVDKKEDLAHLAKLSPGDPLTVQGRMKEITQASAVTIISLSPCELLEQRP